MGSIDLAELTGYREDAEVLRKFQRPYLLPCIGAMVIAIAGFVLMISEMEASHYHHGSIPNVLDKIWFQFQRFGLGMGAMPQSLDYLPIIIFAAGLLIFAGTMTYMAMASPPSSIPNVKMERYWNANPDRPGDKEIVYVDRAAQTYFRRVFVSRSGPRTSTAPWVP
jgi:hypothetical protein